MMSALNSRLDAFEAFRVQTEDAAAHYMTLELYETRHGELHKSLTDVREKLATYMAEQDGRSAGIHSSTAMFFAIPALIATVVSVATTLIALLT